MNRILIFVLLIISIFCFSIVIYTNRNIEAPTESPRYRDIVDKSFFLGRFKPKEIVSIQPEISAIVDSVFVTVGDSVKIGDKIALLRIIPDPLSIQEASATLKMAEKDFAQKLVDYRRIEKLYNKDVLPRIDFEKSKLDFDFSKIELENAANKYNIARKGYSSSSVETPNIVKSTIDGSILEVRVEKGMSVTERNNFNDGSTIVKIGNLETFFFDFQVGEDNINKITLHDTFDISVRALDGKIVRATVSELKPVFGKNNNFAYQAKAKVIEPIDLRVGFTGLAEFVLKEETGALSIKEKNIKYKGRKAFVLKYLKDNDFEEVPVELGITNGIYTVIKSGISSEDKIKIL